MEELYDIENDKSEIKNIINDNQYKSIKENFKQNLIYRQNNL